MKPINLYKINIFPDDFGRRYFQKYEALFSERSDPVIYRSHEIDSLKALVRNLLCGVSVSALDGFFYSFTIPQIGKEFDLIKLSSKAVLNIELKSRSTIQSMREQLVKNRYYLSHLSVPVYLFTYSSVRDKLYRLDDYDNLSECGWNELYYVLKHFGKFFDGDIETKFRASHFLVSPFNNPEKYLKGEYFLTQQQAQIKSKILESLKASTGSRLIKITGKTGTGKSLVLYDLAKDLCENKSVCIIHGGKLAQGHIEIGQRIKGLSVVSRDDFSLGKAKFDVIMFDETQRFDKDFISGVVKAARENGTSCVFGVDPEQVLTEYELENRIGDYLDSFDGIESHYLNSKIRMNEKTAEFIDSVFNLNYKSRERSFDDIEIIYAEYPNQAKEIFKYYLSKGYTAVRVTRDDIHVAIDGGASELIGREYERVIVSVDNSFYYSHDGLLRSDKCEGSSCLPEKLLYQALTRVKEKLVMVIVDNPEFFSNVMSIISR